MRLKADGTLLLVAAIWGSAFVAQRVGAAHIGPLLFNGARFLLAVLVLLPVVRFKLKLDRKTWPWVGAAGLLMSGGSLLQQAGMQWTTAGNAGFITGLYVVFVPLLLLIFWRQRVRVTVWLAAFLAAGGIFLLSAGGQLRLAPGDALELAGAVRWGAHIVVVGQAMRRMQALPFSIGQYLVAGALQLLLGLIFESKTVPGLATAWWTVAYTGILSVAVGYTLQVAAQKYALPTDAALILSLEAAFAALAGFFWLGERLGPEQLAGAGLIMAAILLAQFGPVAAEGARVGQDYSG
jgi:drug/metabolite transporter (DMT)-like permease